MRAKDSRNSWLVGYFPHLGKVQKPEKVVRYWYRHRTIEEAAETARWLIGALSVAPHAADDSARELAQFRTPDLPNGGGVGWRVGPYDVVLQDWGPLNKPDSLNPMGRLLMVAEEINAGRVYASISGYVATAGYNLKTEVSTLQGWEVAEFSRDWSRPGTVLSLTDKGKKWLNTYGDWKVTWYSDFADLPHDVKYFRGNEAEARAYAERLAGKCRNVKLQSPLGKVEILASDVLDIRRK